VDVARQSTPLEVGESPGSQRRALQQLLDQAAIRDLAAMYAIVRDDHDIDALMECFAPDGAFIHDGEPIRGREALREYYLGNMRRNAFSHHIPHSHLIEFIDEHNATGVVTGHGEFADRTTLSVCAYRYDDEYVKIDGRWMFAERGHAFMYYVPVGELATLGRDTLRIRVSGAEAREAEWLPRPV
jgi:hypothetical protein